MTMSRFVTSRLLLLALSYSHIDITCIKVDKYTKYTKYREYIILWAVDHTGQSPDSTKNAECSTHLH